MKEQAATNAIGKRLATLRGSLGLKQADIGKRCGISPQAWNNYETGDRRMSLDAAIKIRLATNVTLDWLYLGITMGLPATLLDYIRSNEPKGGDTKELQHPERTAIVA